MFNIPERYRTDVKISLKDFVPTDLKFNDKKRIKDAIKSVKLVYQITGEEIPSVVNECYRCQVIQFYDIELMDIKEANFLASMYQNLIKPFCIIRMYDTKDELYSLAIKRLNHLEEMQVIVEQSLLTPKYVLNIPDSSKNRFLAYVDYIQVKNKQDKVSMYKEWFYKAYILQNDKAYSNVNLLLESNFWYDSRRTTQIVSKYMELIKQRECLKKATTNAERMKVNKLIRTAIRELDREEW